MVDRVDAFQRRHPAVGFPLAVFYKYFDDQGPYLAAIIAYYGFVAIFPLLLITSSVLGFFLEGNPDLQDRLLESALSSFPIVGTQLGRPEGLSGSTSAVVVGTIAALYGALGLGQATQNALNIAWAIPRNKRLNPFLSRWRSLIMLTLAGLAILAITILSGVLSNLTALGLDDGPVLRWGGTAVSVVLTGSVVALLLRYTTARRLTFNSSLPGGMVIAVLWHVLQLGGGLFVDRVIATANEMNGIFALVLGLIALLYVAAIITVLGIEVNVVWARRLFPRALLTPFTDAVTLTEADRRAYDSYAKAQRHKGFQQVEVSFDPDHVAGPPDR